MILSISHLVSMIRIMNLVRILRDSASDLNSRGKKYTLTCGYCKRPGRILSECFRRKSEVFPNADITLNQIHECCQPDIKEEFKPFVSEVFHDTGTAQSLLLGGVLPFDGRSSIGESCLRNWRSSTKYSFTQNSFNLGLSVRFSCDWCLSLSIKGISLLLGTLQPLAR